MLSADDLTLGRSDPNWYPAPQARQNKDVTIDMRVEDDEGAFPGPAILGFVSLAVTPREYSRDNLPMYYY